MFYFNQKNKNLLIFRMRMIRMSSCGRSYLSRFAFAMRSTTSIPLMNLSKTV